MPAPLSALRHRDFRIYFVTQIFSILGGFIQQVALSWLVYRLTGSSELLGVTAFCTLAPQLLIGPVAGAWIDRHDKRRLLILAELLLASQALLLAVLTWSGEIGPRWIVAMSLLFGALSAVELPTRQSLLLAMVGNRDDLGNAVTLNASIFNIGRFVGPPIAGLLIGLTSEAFCFALNAVSFTILIGGILAMRFERNPVPSAERSTVRGALHEGLAFAWHTWPVRRMLLALVISNLTASTYVVLLPLFAKLVFAGNAGTLGTLWGTVGGGAFIGTLFLTTRRSPAHAADAVMGCLALSALALIVFSQVEHFAIAIPAMALLGFGLATSNVGTNAVLQNITPDHLRGRVISLFIAGRFGFEALGGLAAGILAAHSGAPRAMLIEGLVLAVAALGLLQGRSRLVAEVEQQYREAHP